MLLTAAKGILLVKEGSQSVHSCSSKSACGFDDRPGQGYVSVECIRM